MTKFRDQQGRIHRLGDGGDRFRGSRPSRNAAPVPGAFDGRSIDDKLAEIGEIIEELERSPALKDLITEIDPIERSPLLQDILSKLELIDLNAITLMEDILRSTHFHDLTRQHGDKISTAFHQLTLLDEGLKVTAQSLTDLFARVDGIDSSQQAHYQELIEAIADEISARVTALSELHAQMVEGDNAVSAALAQQISEVEVTAEQARASLQTTLAAAIMDGDTAVSQALNQTISEAIATAEAARASLKTFLEAQIADGDAALSTAINHRIDTVEADAAGARASMQNTLQTQFTNADNAVTAALAQQISEAVSTAEAARASLKTQLQAQIVGGDNAVSAALNNRIDEVEADAASARASSTAHLQAQIDDGETARAALNLKIDTVEVTAQSARAALKENLQAQIVDGDTLVSGALNTRVDTVEANANTALASAVTTLNAQIADQGTVLSDAFNERIDTVEADAGSALASTKTLLMAQIADSNAAMQTIVDTKVNADEAATIAQTKVQAFQDGNFALLQQEFNVVAGEHAGMYGQWQANYSVKINAGTVGGKPVVAGIALSANPETGSDFIVMSDRFAVVPPSYTNSTQAKLPFVVGQVNGVNTVGIQGQLLVDGSITANKITANTLSAITANMGTVNGGTFKTHTLDANGNVTDPTEFRAEISNVGNWPLWIGSGTKTANNAVVWIDKQGNAEFKGKIKAGNVVGQFQSATAVNWNGAVPIQNEMKTIHVFSLAPPLAIGESHIPSMTLTLRLNEQGAGLRVLLEQKQGSVWVPLTEWESGGVTAKSTLEGGFFGVGGMHSHSFMAGTTFGNTSSASTPAISIPAHSHWVATTVSAKVATIAAVGNPVNTATEFRVRAESTSNVNVVNISGFVFGIR